MLDSQNPRPLPQWPHLHVYPDEGTPQRFYVFSDPRLDPAEGPSLLLYRRGGQLTGGQLSLTTTLGLTPAEDAEVRAALGVPDQSPAELLSPQWTEGRVAARVGDDVSLTGRPSLMGANTCALSAELSGDQAQAVTRSWDGAQAWLTLEYDVAFLARVQRTSSHRPRPGLTVKTHGSDTTSINRTLTRTVRPPDGRRTEIDI